MKAMKWLVCLLLCALLAVSALAEVPASQGAVTDLADVLSAETAADMETLSQRLQKATGGRLYVLTRHFLGGQDINTYGQQVFEAWKLGKKDALLLLVIGEETYALIEGGEVQKTLSAGDALRTFLSNNLSAAYRARNYDQAVAGCATAYAKKMAGNGFDVSGIFKSTVKTTKNNSRPQAEEHYMFSSNWFEEPPMEDSGLGGALVLPVLIVVGVVLLRIRKKKKTVTYARYSGSYRLQEQQRPVRPSPQKNRGWHGPGPFGW